MVLSSEALIETIQWKVTTYEGTESSGIVYLRFISPFASLQLSPTSLLQWGDVGVLLSHISGEKQLLVRSGVYWLTECGLIYYRDRHRCD